VVSLGVLPRKSECPIARQLQFGLIIVGAGPEGLASADLLAQEVGQAARNMTDIGAASGLKRHQAGHRRTDVPLYQGQTRWSGFSQTVRRRGASCVVPRCGWGKCCHQSSSEFRRN